MPIEFSKYHGLGNDFLLVYKQHMDAPAAAKILDRHYGVGADGLIHINPSEAADFSFVLYQPDGSVAEVSGNGLRCVGKFLYEKNITDQTSIKIEAAGQLKLLELSVENGIVTGVRADMGLAVDEGRVELHGRVWRKINTGNPHAVTIVDDIQAAPVDELGPLIENDPHFPNRTNVEFIMVEPPVVHARFWERGVGPTLASGTGSCASLVASGLAEATVRTLGGDLHIQLDEQNRLFMTGPAEHVFDGRV